jgi:hypothetical protein
MDDPFTLTDPEFFTRLVRKMAADFGWDLA